jgi:hypothetical protein
MEILKRNKPGFIYHILRAKDARQRPTYQPKARAKVGKVTI